jgi:hypothetical protein
MLFTKQLYNDADVSSIFLKNKNKNIRHINIVV